MVTHIGSSTSISSTQPSLERTTSVLSNDTHDGDQNMLSDTTTKKPTCKKSPEVLPYIKGVSEQIRRVFKQYDVPAYFKPMNSLRQLLVRPKYKILNEQVVKPVYHIPCDSCDASHIGEIDHKKCVFWSKEDPASPPRKYHDIYL